MYAKFHQNIPLSSRDRAISHFQNLELGKASTDEKCHFAISWLDLVNINVYSNVYQNIPLSSRDRAIFTFSEFEPRQRLGQSQMTFDNPLGYILSISMHLQILSKYSKRFKSYRHFFAKGRGQNFHRQSKDKIFTNCPGTKIKCLIIGHSMKFSFKFQLTFLGSCNLKIYTTK